MLEVVACIDSIGGVLGDAASASSIMGVASDPLQLPETLCSGTCYSMMHGVVSSTS